MECQQGRAKYIETSPNGRLHVFQFGVPDLDLFLVKH